MTDLETGAALSAAMETYVEASETVTSILIRIAAGEAIEPSEIESARKAEVLATGRYMSAVAHAMVAPLVK